MYIYTEQYKISKVQHSTKIRIFLTRRQSVVTIRNDSSVWVKLTLQQKPIARDRTDKNFHRHSARVIERRNVPRKSGAQNSRGNSTLADNWRNLKLIPGGDERRSSNERGRVHGGLFHFD